MPVFVKLKSFQADRSNSVDLPSFTDVIDRGDAEIFMFFSEKCAFLTISMCHFKGCFLVSNRMFSALE